jgi:NADPH-dependent curcumin reductase CurA
MISTYNITNPEEKYGVKNLDNIVFKSLLMQGFIVTEYLGTSIEKEFERDIVEWVKTGKIIYKEKVIDGIENVPKAFVDLLEGNNTGKTLVRIANY